MLEGRLNAMCLHIDSFQWRHWNSYLRAKKKLSVAWKFLSTHKYESLFIFLCVCVNLVGSEGVTNISSHKQIILYRSMSTAAYKSLYDLKAKALCKLNLHSTQAYTV